MAARPGPSKNRRGAQRTPRVLVLSGPNLDRLGRREPEIYGSTTLPQIHTRLEQLASELGAGVECRQSAHEGALVEWIGAAGAEGFDAVVINPGAYSHTSIALLDAIHAANPNPCP